MGKGHQGVVGPLLQPEGQSCFPRTNWLPPEGVPVHVAAVPGLRMWGSVFASSFPNCFRAGPWPSTGF